MITTASNWGKDQASTCPPQARHSLLLMLTAMVQPIGVACLANGATDSFSNPPTNVSASCLLSKRRGAPERHTAYMGSSTALWVAEAIACTSKVDQASTCPLKLATACCFCRPPGCRPSTLSLLGLHGCAKASAIHQQSSVLPLLRQVRGAPERRISNTVSSTALLVGGLLLDPTIERGWTYCHPY